MGEPQTLHFYDFGTCERVPEPQHQLFLSLQAPRHLTKTQENPWNVFKSIKFINVNLLEIQNMTILEIQNFENVRKGGRRNIPTIRVITS